MTMDIGNLDFVLRHKLSARIVSPDGSYENHIESVDVYSSDDDFKLLDGAVRCTVDEAERTLVIQPIKKTVPPQVGRFRFEPAVRIKLIAECTEEPWYLYIYHHKGIVSLRAEQVNGEAI